MLLNNKNGLQQTSISDFESIPPQFICHTHIIAVNIHNSNYLLMSLYIHVVLMFMSFNKSFQYNCESTGNQNRSLKTNFRSNKKIQPQLHWHQHNQYVIQSLNPPIPPIFSYAGQHNQGLFEDFFNGGYCQKATRLHDSIPIFPTNTPTISFMYKWGVWSYSQKFPQKLAAKKNFQCKKQKLG